MWILNRYIFYLTVSGASPVLKENVTDKITTTNKIQNNMLVKTFYWIESKIQNLTQPDLKCSVIDINHIYEKSTFSFCVILLLYFTFYWLFSRNTRLIFFILFYSDLVLQFTNRLKKKRFDISAINFVEINKCVKMSSIGD